MAVFEGTDPEAYLSEPPSPRGPNPEFAVRFTSHAA